MTNPIPGKRWTAVLAWTVLGCVFALPDLSAGTGRRHALLLSLTFWWSWGHGHTSHSLGGPEDPRFQQFGRRILRMVSAAPAGNLTLDRLAATLPNAPLISVRALFAP